MKRLYQLLLFITLFVLAPITVDAQNAGIYFYNAANASKEVAKNTSLNHMGGTFSVEYDGTKLYDLCGKSQTVYFKLYVDFDGTRTLSPTDATVTVGTPNATFTEANVSATAQFDMGSDYASNKYVFEIKLNNGKSATVKVTKKPAPSKYWVSTDNGSSWAEIVSGSSIYKNSFKLKKVQGSTTTYFTATDNTLTLGKAAAVATTETDSTEATTFTFDTTNSGPYGYTLTFNDNSLTVTDESVDHAYYLVIKELNKSFRLVPSRSREGGPLSTRLFTINFKDDELRKLFTEANVAHPTAITYYIKKVKAGEDDVCFRPVNNNDEIPTTSGSTSDNVESGTYKDTETSGTTDNNFKLTLGKGVSYTWQFDNSDKCPLTLDINTASLDQNVAYTLLGNFSQAKANIKIDPTDNAFHNKLTRVVYTRSRRGVGIPSDKPVTEKAGGTGYTVTLTDGGTAEDVDSVIYRITVPRPAEGWGQLYLIVAPTDKVGTNWNKDRDWDYETIRPQVQGYSEGKDNTGMDGIALRGGLFKATGNKNSSKTATTNMDQALNPQVTTRYHDATSYTFSMNATTSTYRIIFSSDKMYIIGTGVSSTNTDAKKTTVKDASDQDVTMYKVGLVWDHEKQCFKHVNGEGKETPVTLSSRSGSNGFRFAYGGNFTNTWFGENGNNTSSNTDDPNVPADLSSKDKAYTAGGENFDNQYVNHVQSYVSSSNTYADSTMDIKFQLPATDATNNTTDVIIRLYLKLIDDEAHYFYDIRKSYTFHRCAYTDNSVGLDGELKDTDYFRMFSDYQAHKKPSYMDAYVLTNVSAESATFTKLETDYIPVNTGVLLIAHLADKLKNQTPDKVNITLGLYADNPQAKYTGSKNYLTAQTPETTLNYKNDDGTFNYIIVNHSIEKPGGGYLKSGLNFYRPAANVKTGRSYAYLKNIDKAIDESKNTQAKEANLVIPIDSEGELDFIHATQLSQEDNNAYYTLQGVRVAAPTTKGIYIHNGKKTIVR